MAERLRPIGTASRASFAEGELSDRAVVGAFLLFILDIVVAAMCATQLFNNAEHFTPLDLRTVSPVVVSACVRALTIPACRAPSAKSADGWAIPAVLCLGMLGWMVAKAPRQ